MPDANNELYDFLSNQILDKRKLLVLAASSVVFIFAIGKFYILLLIATILFGGLLSQYLFGQNTEFPNLLWYTRDTKDITSLQDELALMKKICPVCGKEKCSRHRPELNILALQPWTDVYIPERVDKALSEILDHVMKEFVLIWYKELSNDEAFKDEIKSSLRFLIAVLLRRCQKVDLPSFIINKVLKAAIKHLHFFIEVKKRASEGEDIQQSVLDFYGSSLHICLLSRRAELHYLRCTTEKLFPYILPVHSLNCRSLRSLLKEIFAGVVLLPSMDKLADPDIVNNLLLLFFDNSPPPPEPVPSESTLILNNFAKPLYNHDSCLHLGMEAIFKNQITLLPLMQFLISEASVNVLQFYLDVEEFNGKILNPDLKRHELEELHENLRKIYNTYIAYSAVDRIKFDEDIVVQIKAIADGSPSDIVKLQTSTPLFRAHEHAYDLIERTFLPLFHQSDDYYQFLCGVRLPTMLTRTSSSSSISSTKSNNNNRGSQRKDPISKLGTRIKEVFSSNIVDGSPAIDIDYAEETNPDLTLKPESFQESNTEDGPLHNLSNWRVTIKDVITKLDPENTRKSINAYLIDVRRVDVTEDDYELSNWCVERRYHEFYVLEQKLTEFHGYYVFGDISLPAKKSFGIKGKEFLEARKEDFELYLQKLLGMSKLKGSELLYNFLTSKHEFTSRFLQDINLGKIVKTGAMKFVKEKGQHLDLFLSSFLSSTESPKPKPNRDREADTVSMSSENMLNSIYENNANMEADLSDFTPMTPVRFLPGWETPIEGLYDTILYLVHHVFQAPRWLLTVLQALRMAMRHSLDKFVDWYLDLKLKKVLQEHRIEHIIQLLQDALFYDMDPPRSDAQRKARQEETFQELKNFIPSIFTQIIGTEQHTQGCRYIFEALQQPKLNKQLSYVLLDLVLEEVFPELCSGFDINSPRYRTLDTPDEGSDI